MNMKPILIAFSVSALFLSAADKSKTWTDPALALKEDTDFSIQGEYHRKGAALGAQIVALGDGKFDLYVLEGGLPGLGWKKKDSRIKISGSLKKGTVTFAKTKNC